MDDLKSYGRAKSWLVSKWGGIFHRCPPSKWKRGGRHPSTTVSVIYDIRGKRVVGVSCARCGGNRSMALSPKELDLQNKLYALK